MAAHSSTTAAPPSADALERSLRSFSIHDSGRPRRYGATHSQPKKSITDLITLDLNSETSLPYNWEQCLDLKTGEIYFINRSSGVKTKDDPREMAEYRGEYYYSDDEEDEEEDESCVYDTDEEGCGSNLAVAGTEEGEENNVLVAAGCRSCLMYYMVPKQVTDCPKCNRQLLHFDRLEKLSSPAHV